MSVSIREVGQDQEAQDLREEMERRVALATVSDTVRGLLFLGTLESVKALGGQAGVEACLEVAGEPRFVEFFNYPVGTYLRVNDVAARVLAPLCGGWEEAQRRLGRQSMGGMLKSATGRALVLVSRGQPRQLVGNLPSAYRAAVNFGERTVTWEGPSRGRVLMRRDFLPCAYHEGVLLAALEGLKVSAPQVRGQRLGELDSEYLVSWG
ncbi:DUF2378 family protein [Archangium sp.]|uniref:DUF2378 family protein n=1 Tax=Archangium sp. TaxID=1872627 RepID=UPI002ED84E6E